VSTRTSIEWTRADDGAPGRTWNPVTGCTKVSPGCDHCYAESIARRFAGTKAFPHGFALTLHPERLGDPGRWRAPSRVFVNSMSDLFHQDVPDGFIAKVFAVMARAERHTFQILTKRPARMRALLSDGGQALMEATTDEETALSLYDCWWPLPNVWLGVSVETQHWAQLRIPALLETPAEVRFVSAEPLLGALDLRRIATRHSVLDALTGDVADPVDGAVYTAAPAALDWVITGAESGC
jgi:protein gp37